MDKLLQYESIIQAFSRANRLFGPEKPFGTIRYYRRPHTMEKYIAGAVKLYSGDKPIGLFVQKLEENLNKLNVLFGDIKKVFADAGVPDFEKNPEGAASCGRFAVLFKRFNEYFEAAKIQKFRWEQQEYEFLHGTGHKKTVVTMDFEENAYLILALRYKELFPGAGGGGGDDDGDVPFEIDGHLTEIDTGKIDADYMNSRFNKYLKLVKPESSKELIDQALADLHKTFATLTQEEQKYANIFLHDVQRGDIVAEEGKTLRDYITEYQIKAKDEQIRRIVDIFCVNEAKLREMMSLKLTEANINEYGRFDTLKDAIDKRKARLYFEKQQGAGVPPWKVNTLVDKHLRHFLLTGGFDVD
jgi:type I restriction enzyme R subunit